MASSMVKIKDKEEVAFLRERVKHWRAGRDEAIEDISCKEFSFAQVSTVEGEDSDPTAYRTWLPGHSRLIP